MKATLIYNPMAGRFPSLPLVERAANLLETNGWEIEIARKTREIFLRKTEDIQPERKK